MKQPIKMTPGDDLHLTMLMALYSLNLVTGQDRRHLLGYGRAAFEAGKASQCLLQIQEPASNHSEIPSSSEMSNNCAAAVAVPDERAAFELAYATEWQKNRAGSETVEQLAAEIVGWREGATYPDDMPYLKNTWDGYQWARAALAGTPAADMGNPIAQQNQQVAAPVVLPEQDATLLNQGVELLHALSNDERNRGNCSAAEGATASAHAVQRLAALLASVGQPDDDAAPETPNDDQAVEHYVSDCDGSGIHYDAQSYERGFRSGKALGKDEATGGQAQAGVDSLGIPISCGKPLCSPDQHHPLCKLAAPQQADARDAESDYQRGYRHGYNRRDAEVQGALL